MNDKYSMDHTISGVDDSHSLLVEEFLREHTLEVADDGFSDRVMKSIPVSEWNNRMAEEWRSRLSTLWTVFCVTALLAILLFTDIVDILTVDAIVYVHTLFVDGVSLKVLICLALLPTAAFSLGAKAVYNKIVY